MKSFTAETSGRLLVIGLSKGDLFLECVESEIKKHGIENGVVVSAIGTFKKAVFHYITTVSDKPEDKTAVIKAPMELSAVQGLIINSKPHFHMAFSHEEKAYTGHLEPGCEIQYLAEICIMEIKSLNAVRKTDEYGVSYLDNF